MGKVINKLNSIVDKSKFEYFFILIIVVAIFITIYKEFSVELNKGNSALLLSVLGTSIAYAVFFISYQENFIENKEEKRSIKILIEALFVSSFFPVIVVLAMSGNMDFGLLNKFIIWPLVILTMISLFVFTFCIIELWLFMLKKVIKGFIIKLKNL